MSTENVALFMQALSQDVNLGKRVSTSDVASSSWASIAADAGYEFSEDDIHKFACQVLDNSELDREGAVQALLDTYIDGEALSEDDLVSVAGGTGKSFKFSGPFRIKVSFSSRIGALGYPNQRNFLRTIGRGTWG
jgi:predicted ribosomally synthesized peptide with nif11-like leader